MPSVEQLLQKLDALRAVDPSFQAFGAANHEYQLDTTLSAEELAAFEAEHKVKLPAEYRDFLLHAGDGGAGPVYGLQPLALWQPDSFTQVTTVIKDREGNVLAEAGTGPRPALARPAEPWRPFGLSGAWQITPGEGAGGPDTLPDGVHPFDGCTFLADIGCGYSYFLVITGPRAGEVWEDYTAGDGAISPTGLGFFAWYDRWLDESICTSVLSTIKAQLEGNSKWEPEALLAPHLASFEVAVAAHPEWAMGQVNLAYMKLYLRRVEEAEHHLEKARALAPELVEIELARVYVLRAKAAHERVLETIAALSSGGRFLGYKTEGSLVKMKYGALKHLSRWPEVLEVGAKVIEHNFYEANLRYELAFFMLLHRDRESCEASLQRAAVDFCEEGAEPDAASWLSGFAHGCRINGHEEDALYFEAKATEVSRRAKGADLGLGQAQ